MRTHSGFGILRQMRFRISQELHVEELRIALAKRPGTLITKVWNATRYIVALLGRPSSRRATPPPIPAQMTLADRWIVTRLRRNGRRHQWIPRRRPFGSASETVWRFIWYEFCDWYLEATKAPENRATRAAVLSFVWNAAMRLLHPFAPFISEEVWLTLPHDGQTIVTASWPDIDDLPALPARPPS